MKPMLKLPYTQYQWSKWDCFTLANYVRNFIDDSSLPNIDWVYKEYTEQSQPNRLVLDIVENYCKKTENLETGCIVILDFNGVANLGTVYKNSIIYMGKNRATYQPIERLSEYIHSIWIYNP